MGLASLIKVAQGKNASNVSFEDSFLKEYEEAVRKKELEERQVAPSDYIRPSSMYGCERMIFFQRIHSGSLNGEQSDVPLIEICQSGTDRHLDIQHIVERMEGVECLDLEEVVKEANQRGIKTEFVGWNEDHTEARCKNDELSIYFQPDGVIRFMGKEVILEVKTESTYQFSTAMSLRRIIGGRLQVMVWGWELIMFCFCMRIGISVKRKPISGRLRRR